MRDPRHLSLVKLVPPAPLPHVSRKALARVTDPLPAPTTCSYCQSPVELISNERIYGIEYGEWPYAYSCTGCDAYVGLHPHTDVPLGTLADSALRAARKRSKAAFAAATRLLGISERRNAYMWLANAMNIPVPECHFAWFDQNLCRRAERVCNEIVKNKQEKQHDPRMD